MLFSSVFSIDICISLQKTKSNFMNLLFAQAAANTQNESTLMIIGIGALLVSLALLLWKKDTRTAA